MRLTSKPPMNGAMLSGSSGDTAPYSFQYCVRPSLILDAWSGESVRLNRIATAFPSWG